MALTPSDGNVGAYVARVCYSKTQLNAGQLDSRYYARTEFTDTSAGVGDAGKPVKLNSSGLLDATMMVGGSVATHAALTAAHGATGAVVGTTNTQVLTNKELASALYSGTVTVTGPAVFTGGITSGALTSDNVRIGTEAGTPRIWMENSGVGQWGIDVDPTDLLRFFVPGLVKMTLDPSGNLTTTGTFAAGGAITSNSVAVPTISSTDTLTNKTLTSPTLTTPTIANFTNAQHTHVGPTSGSVLDHSSLTSIGTNPHGLIDAHIAATAAHGATGAVVGTTSTQTLTLKTLTDPLISRIYGGANANDDITIHGTSNATRTTSSVLLQPTAGNVGVGPSTTQDSFQVNSVLADTAQNLAGLRMGNVSGAPRLTYEYDNTHIYSQDLTSAGTLRWFTPGTVRAALTAAGKMVVGGSTLDDTFEVQDNGASTNRITFELNNAGANKIHSYTTAPGTFTAADLYITGGRIWLSGARVNIGTGTPVNGGTPTTSAASDITSDASFLYVATGVNTWKRIALVAY